MEKRAVNPWAWQNEVGYAQAVEVSGAQRTLYCSGQTTLDAEGKPNHPGDLRAQFNEAFGNLETVPTQAGYALSDIVRLNYYTTDMDGLYESWNVHIKRFAHIEPKPSLTVVGVTRLAFPELLIEIEAAAAK